jgi:hypothetical protein
LFLGHDGAGDYLLEYGLNSHYLDGGWIHWSNGLRGNNYSLYAISGTLTFVPEAGTATLMLVGLAALGSRGRIG